MGKEEGDGMTELQTVGELLCLRCGHKWLPRSVKRPEVCPHCKRYDWDVAPKEVKDEIKST